MAKYRKKIMALTDVLKSRLKRHKDKFKDLEILVDSKAATSIQKQSYIDLKARIEEDEIILDIAEGLIKK